MKIEITGIVKQIEAQIGVELASRAIRAANELRNASLEVLRGKRSGRTYRTPAGATYTASAPGEPPAVRTGELRLSWRTAQGGPDGKYPAIESHTPYAWLDQGSPNGRIKPRPYSKRIIEMARPKVEAIYQEPFNISV